MLTASAAERSALYPMATLCLRQSTALRDLQLRQTDLALWGRSPQIKCAATDLASGSRPQATPSPPATSHINAPLITAHSTHGA